MPFELHGKPWTREEYEKPLTREEDEKYWRDLQKRYEKGPKTSELLTEEIDECCDLCCTS